MARRKRTLVNDGTKRGINLVGLEGGFGGDPEDADNNWLRSVGPEPDHNYPIFKPKLLDYYHSKNIKLIRLLFSWDRMQSQLWGTVPDPIPGYAKYFADFKQIVDYATSLGITVIIEPWQANSSGGTGGPMWLGHLIGDSPAHVDRYAFADFWQKLATIFKSNPLVEYGLVNEPNHMSTMSWWTTAQKCIDYIRAAGATTTIYVPGNGYTGAGAWTDSSVDTDTPQVSNAYAWLHVNDGQPLFDPLGRAVAEVHVYMDENADGLGDDVPLDKNGHGKAVLSKTAARDRLKAAMSEAQAGGYSMFIGEVAVWANAHGTPTGQDAWADFIDYVENPKPSAFVGYAWWAGGRPDFWHDDDPPHFSVSPTDGDNFTGDSVHMDMIEKNF
jgi:endoglucanase